MYPRDLLCHLHCCLGCQQNLEWALNPPLFPAMASMILDENPIFRLHMAGHFSPVNATLTVADRLAQYLSISFSLCPHDLSCELIQFNNERKNVANMVYHQGQSTVNYYIVHQILTPVHVPGEQRLIGEQKHHTSEPNIKQHGINLKTEVSADFAAASGAAFPIDIGSELLV